MFFVALNDPIHPFFPVGLFASHLFKDSDIPISLVCKSHDMEKNSRGGTNLNESYEIRRYREKLSWDWKGVEIP